MQLLAPVEDECSGRTAPVLKEWQERGSDVKRQCSRSIMSWMRSLKPNMRNCLNFNYLLLILYMKHKLIICISALCLGLLPEMCRRKTRKCIGTVGSIFNKNGVKDIYEDPSQPVEKRVADLLSQMSVEEKTCQLATLYGYGRVLKDSLPVAGWKNEIWKDGIANIDEMLNGVGKKSAQVPGLLYPFSNHAEAVNTVQRWFVEETRLGIPVDFTNEGFTD